VIVFVARAREKPGDGLNGLNDLNGLNLLLQTGKNFRPTPITR
jgi:hypothetical protein